MGFFKKLFGGGDAKTQQRARSKPSRQQQNGAPPGDLEGLMAYYNNMIATGDYDGLVPLLDNLFFGDMEQLADLTSDMVIMKMDQNPQLAAQPMASLSLSANIHQATLLTGAHFYTRLGMAYYTHCQQNKAAAECHKKCIRLVKLIPGAQESGVGNHLFVIAYVGLAQLTNNPQTKIKLLREAMSLPHNDRQAFSMQALAKQQLQELGQT